MLQMWQVLWCRSGRGGEILLQFGNGLRAGECVGAGELWAGGRLGIKPH